LNLINTTKTNFFFGNHFLVVGNPTPMESNQSQSQSDNILIQKGISRLGKSIGFGAYGEVFEVKGQDGSHYVLKIAAYTPHSRLTNENDSKWLAELQENTWVVRLFKSWTMSDDDARVILQESIKERFLLRFQQEISVAQDRMPSLTKDDKERSIRTIDYTRQRTLHLQLFVREYECQLQHRYQKDLFDLVENLFETKQNPPLYILDRLVFICVALSAKGLIHGDIKMPNFMIDQDHKQQDRWNIVLGDFGYTGRASSCVPVRIGWNSNDWGSEVVYPLKNSSEYELQIFALFINLEQLFQELNKNGVHLWQKDDGKVIDIRDYDFAEKHQPHWQWLNDKFPRIHHSANRYRKRLYAYSPAPYMTYTIQLPVTWIDFLQSGTSLSVDDLKSELNKRKVKEQNNIINKDQDQEQDKPRIQRIQTTLEFSNQLQQEQQHITQKRQKCC